jgi:trimeric autotransporter adhesin
MRRALLFALGSLVATLALAASASAYMTAHGAGSAVAAVGSLHAPATPTGSPNGVGAVDVGWHQSTLSDGTTKAASYYVSRYSGATLDGYACGTSPTGTTIPAANADGSGNFTCTDSGLTLAGPYTYTVTALYKHWTAESAKSSSVTVALFGPLDHFVLTPNSTTPTAGATDNLTITAKDSGGRTVTNYTGSHSLTFSGASSIGANNPKVTNSSGSGIAFGSSTSISFTNGVSSVSSGNNGVMTLFKAETASIVVSDGTHTNGTGLSVTVSPASSNKLAYVQQPSNTTAGQTISPSVTVAIQDTFGNQTTSTANVTVSPSSQTLLGTKTQAAVSGLATFDDLSMTKSGSYTLSASASGLTGRTSNSFTIGAASASQLAFTTQPSNTASGSSITPSPAVSVQDTFGNTVTTSTASVTIAIGTNPSSGTLSGTVTRNASSGVASFTGLSMDKAGIGYTLSASATGLTGAASGSFNIIGPPFKLVFSQQPNGGAGDANFGTQPKVTVQDSAGSTVTTDNGAVTLAIGTNPNFGALACTNNTVNASAGVATFSSCSIDSAGNGYTLTASRTGLTGATSNTFNITGLSPTGLSILNGTGTAGKAESGDVITIPFNQAISLSSVCNRWSTASQTVSGVTVTMARGGSGHTNDLSFSLGNVSGNSCSGGVNIGTFAANTNAYNLSTSSVSWANSTVTWNAGTNSLIITLSGTGAPSGTASSNNTYTYTPDSSIVSSSGSIGVTGKQAVTATNF